VDDSDQRPSSALRWTGVEERQERYREIVEATIKGL